MQNETYFDKIISQGAAGIKNSFKSSVYSHHGGFEIEFIDMCGVNYTDIIPDLIVDKCYNRFDDTYKKSRPQIFAIARLNSQPARSSSSVHEKWHQSQNRSCHVWEMSGSARLNSKDSKSPSRADQYESTSKSIKKGVQISQW